MATVIQERWEKIQTLSLKHGSHQPDSQFCVMEAVAFVAGEPWSDHPQCACPIISSFLRNWNDRLPSDAERDRLLKHFVPRLVGTLNPKLEVKRVIMIGDWTVRTVVPELLRLMKKDEDADKLAALPEIGSAEKLAEGLDRALALALALDRALARPLARDRDLARDLALDLARALALALARALARALNLDLALALDRALARDLDRALDLAKRLEGSQSALVERMIETS